MTDQHTSLSVGRSGLTEEQCAKVLSLQPGERRMGGYGQDCGVPGLIERVGINHPVFGSHYRLTVQGVQVHGELRAQATNNTISEETGR